MVLQFMKWLESLVKRTNKLSLPDFIQIKILKEYPRWKLLNYLLPVINSSIFPK